MHLLCQRLKVRRKQRRLTQKHLAVTTTPSFISRIERGRDLPSLTGLRKMAAALDTTMGDLLGDLLVLEAAKLTILQPQHCLTYLKELPPTSITRYLASLTTSVQRGSSVPTPPPNAEMHFLAALVHTSRGDTPEALKLIHKGICLARAQPLTKLKLELLLELLSGGCHAEEIHSRIKTASMHTISSSPELITYEDIAFAAAVQLWSLTYAAGFIQRDSAQSPLQT